MRRASCSEQDTKKYCCTSRSSLPASEFVVGVEDLADRLGGDLVVDGPLVVALVEGLEVERLHRLGAPQPQDVRQTGAVAGDRGVVGHALDLAVGSPVHAQAAGLVAGVFAAAPETDAEGDLRPPDLPRIARGAATCR